VILDCEARCDPDSEDGDGIDIKRDLARRNLRTPQKSSWPAEHHFEDQTIEGDLRVLFRGSTPLHGSQRRHRQDEEKVKCSWRVNELHSRIQAGAR
jgi:hypothetical protein